jgi:hypothetical protein
VICDQVGTYRWCLCTSHAVGLRPWAMNGHAGSKHPCKLQQHETQWHVFQRASPSTGWFSDT